MMVATRTIGRLDLLGVIRAQTNVLTALILRDIQTRFGSAPGFFIAIAWPLSHILILVAFNAAFARLVPYGDSGILWFAVSMTPFMIVSYTSRFMMIGLVMNRPLLAFPIISVFDILISRVVIEIMVSAVVVSSLVLIMVCLDVDFMPTDISMALAAVAGSLLLGIGLGTLNAIIAMILPKWVTVYSLSVILFWVTSGVYFIPSNLAAPIRGYLYFHPFMHCIEWLREAYFSSYNSQLLDKAYLLGWGICSVSAGLVIERFLRGRVLVA